MNSYQIRCKSWIWTRMSSPCVPNWSCLVATGKQQLSARCSHPRLAFPEYRPGKRCNSKEGKSSGHIVFLPREWRQATIMQHQVRVDIEQVNDTHQSILRLFLEAGWTSLDTKEGFAFPGPLFPISQFRYRWNITLGSCRCDAHTKPLITSRCTGYTALFRSHATVSIYPHRI